MVAIARPSGLATNRVVSIFVTLVVLLGIIVNYLNLSDDPYRCKALLNDGSWLDKPDADGNRDPFAHWQPHGCMVRQYQKEDVQECMEGRSMYFFGDSTTRQVFYGMARILDREKADDTRSHSHKHGIHDLEFGGVHLRQVWIPLIEDGDARIDVQQTLELYSEERHHQVPVEDQKGPAFIYMGVGIWYAAKMEEGVSLEEFKKVFNNVSDSIHQQDLPAFGTAPMDPKDGVGNELFVAPPAPPFYEAMPKDRKTGIAAVPGELEAINDFMYSVEDETHVNVLWSYPALSRDQLHVMVDLANGYHVIDAVAEAKANILLNLRCNAKLDAKKGFPYERTCCTDYGQKSWVQLVLVASGLVYVGIACFMELSALWSGQPPRQTLFNLDAGIFVTALLACYWADRTQSFAKGGKEYVPYEFYFLIFLAVVAGVVSISKSRPPPAKPGAPDVITTLDDMKPLSRDQTDEWKGWMQAVILIYHWTGASRALDVYIFVRLLVAAYLFQTGYGHAVFFITKKDFSFKRVAAVMLRLNLLSCALPYVMDTTYIFYYFAPLVSFWFVVIYATFAVGQKYNDNLYALFTKIAISVVVFPGLMLYTPLTEWIFAALSFLFRIEWDLHEWQFRLGLDGLIVYIGMIMGIASVKTKLYNKVLTTYGLAGIAGAFGIALYLWAAVTSSGNKGDYNKYHALVSFFPILCFIAARNVNRHARTWYSRSFAWLGRCSLETFTLQFHIYLAADTKGLLLLDIFQGDASLFGDRWRDLVVIAPLFLWISWRVADATGALVKLLTANTGPLQPEADEIDLENKADAEPLMGSSSWLSPITRHMPSKASWIRDLRLRMVALLVLLWALNLLY